MLTFLKRGCSLTFARDTGICRKHVTCVNLVILVVFSLLNIAESSRRVSTFPGRFFDCSVNPPNHYYTAPRAGDNGFQVRIEGEPDSYEPGREYVVALQSTRPASFRGFSIHARHIDNEEAAGSFMPVNAYTSRVSSSCPSYIHHVISGKRNRVMVRWTAPVSGFGCVKISATVVQKGRIWFKDQGRLSLNICERVEVVQPNRTQECCACGNSTYRMTFYGLWSPSTHPKDYPTYSTHWSNVIGASHSSEYSIWDYGEFSSPAVQKVAEWGWPNDVETEVTSQGDHVMSVIKAPAQWPAYQPRNLKNPPSDTFQVDRSRHLVSLLSMLGPSPDWNVGITKESMCTADCGWVGTRVYNLTPWDAGTDSGVSYLSPNSPTNPRQRIRALTTLDDPESPFYKQGGGAIEPVARIVVTRTGLSDGQCGESEAVLEQYDVADTSESTSNKVALCLYSEWGRWSHCGVTCGWGIKTRNREMTMQKSSVACTATMQKEICKGMGDCTGVSADSTVCLYSEWTSWGECTASCGSAVRVRNRALMWPSEETNCREPLKEMSDCGLESCDMGDGCRYSPTWGEWMTCPVACGVGQTVRKRAVTSSGLNCDAIMQTSKCMRSMSCNIETREIPGCNYGEWSDWSVCPVTCGVGQTFRKRMLRSGSHSCDGFQMENSKCMTSMSCTDDDQSECRYSDWSEWMPCSESCGTGATLRKKFLLGDARSNCEGLVMENSPCHNPPCQQCAYLPWTPWMPCSVTCGKGETLRKRFLNQSASGSGCEGFQMEQNRCMVPCAVINEQTCMYFEWMAWQPCTGGCNNTGHRVRKRVLKFAPEELSCERFITERVSCTPPCRKDQCAIEWTSWSSCSASCGRGWRTRRLQRIPPRACGRRRRRERQRCRAANRCAPQNCVVKSWGQWSRCNSPGRSSRQLRVRKIKTRAKFGGAKCPRTFERRRCINNHL